MQLIARGFTEEQVLGMRMDKLQMYLLSDIHIKQSERQAAFIDMVTAINALFGKNPRKAVEGYLKALAETQGDSHHGNTVDRAKDSHRGNG